MQNNNKKNLDSILRNVSINHVFVPPFMCCNLDRCSSYRKHEIPHDICIVPGVSCWKKEKKGVGRDPNVSIGDWCAIIHTLFWLILFSLLENKNTQVSWEGCQCQVQQQKGFVSMSQTSTDVFITVTLEKLSSSTVLSKSESTFFPKRLN